MNLERGSELELTIDDLTVEGGGLARFDGRVIFTDRGLPGERVRVAIDTLKSRFAKAVVLESLAPSPHAAPCHCAYARPGDAGCGGCAWPGLDYTAELAWKDNHVRQTLRRVGGIDQALLNDPAVFAAIVPSPEPLGYRNKMEFAFAPAAAHGDSGNGDEAAGDFADGFAGPAGRALLGLRQRSSHSVLEVEDCPLAAFPVKDILRRVREWAAREKLSAWSDARGRDGKSDANRGFLRHLVLRRKGDSCIAELITATSGSRSRLRQAVIRLADELCSEEAGGTAPCCGFIHSLRSGSAAVAYGESRALERGDCAMEETFAGVTLRAPVPAFLQVNSGAASALYALAQDFACAAAGSEKPGTNRDGGIVDAYCGVGGLALAVARAGETAGMAGLPVLGLESDRAAIKAARENATLNGVAHARFTGGDAVDTLAALDDSPWLLMLDPPRAGLAPRVLEHIIRLSPEFCIMVSCNPATLARDVAGLGDSYTLRRGAAVDMFPHTPHMETILLLEKRRR